MDTKKYPDKQGQKIDNDKNRRQQQQSSPTPGSPPQWSPQKSDYETNQPQPDRSDQSAPGRQDRSGGGGV